MYELAALTQHQRDYHEVSMLLFGEMWLTAQTPDMHAELNAFQLMWVDMRVESSKRKGEGLVVFVNDRCCNSGHIIIKGQLCSQDIELLALASDLTTSCENSHTSQ